MIDKGGMKKIVQGLKPGDGQNTPKKQYRYIAITLLAGIALMLTGIFTEPNKNASVNQTDLLSQEKDPTEKKNETVPTWGNKQAKNSGKISGMEKDYEQQLKGVLETMQGVHDVSVIVNIDATEKKVYEKNGVSQKQITEETDRDGGQRKVEDFSRDEKVVIIREGDKEIPLIQETKKPSIRGVLVVAKGAENMRVKKEIIDAVTRVLDVPSHRVAVKAKK